MRVPFRLQITLLDTFIESEPKWDCVRIVLPFLPIQINSVAEIVLQHLFIWSEIESQMKATKAVKILFLIHFMLDDDYWQIHQISLVCKSWMNTNTINM